MVPVKFETALAVLPQLKVSCEIAVEMSAGVAVI